MKKIVIIAMGLVLSSTALAQEKVETTVSGDFVSSYIWRGQDLGSAAVQPTLGVAYKGLSLTAWGSYALTNPDDVKEHVLSARLRTMGKVRDYDRKVRVVVDEANSIGSEIGQMYSHMALGDICLMSRYDGHTAIDEYAKALQIASTITISQEKYFGIHMDLARAYMECNQYDNAQKIFDDAAKLECVKTPACKMRYYQSYIFLAQKLGMVNEFNELYKKYIDIPEARTSYDEGSLLYFKFLWLKNNKQYAEALELSKQLPLERMRIEAPMTVYKEMGDYEHALALMEKLVALDDSIQREISLNDIATMTLKMQGVEEEIQKAQASANRNLWITIAIGSLFAIVVCSHFVIVRIRRRRKTSFV